MTAHGYPFVVVDPMEPLDEGIASVSATNASGAKAATEHLLALGHRRIGAIIGPPTWLASRERINGFHAALAGAGIAPDRSLEIPSDFEIGGGHAAAAKLLDRPDRPTAIFGFNDNIAIGVIRAARERGLRIPEDISLVGFDDAEEAMLVTPTLTTVRQPLQEMGRMGVSLLSRLLEGQAVEALRVELATKLVVRESTAPPANALAYSANHSPSGTRAARTDRSPSSRIAVAASASALTATQASPPPTLTRCAPAPTISASDSPGSASTFTGFDTASHTARISSAPRRPGA